MGRAAGSGGQGAASAPTSAPTSSTSAPTSAPTWRRPSRSGGRWWSCGGCCCPRGWRCRLRSGRRARIPRRRSRRSRTWRRLRSWRIPGWSWRPRCPRVEAVRGRRERSGAGRAASPRRPPLPAASLGGGFGLGEGRGLCWGSAAGPALAGGGVAGRASKLRGRLWREREAAVDIPPCWVLGVGRLLSAGGECFQEEMKSKLPPSPPAAFLASEGTTTRSKGMSLTGAAVGGQCNLRFCVAAVLQR